MIDAKMIESIFGTESGEISKLMLTLFERGLRDDIIVAIINKALKDAKETSKLKVETPRIPHKCTLLGMDIESWPALQNSSITYTPFTDVCVNIISTLLKDRDALTVGELNELMAKVVEVYKLRNIWPEIGPFGGMEIFAKVMFEKKKLRGDYDDMRLKWFEPKIEEISASASDDDEKEKDKF